MANLQEIRKELNDIDTLACNIVEYFADNDLLDDYEELVLALEHLNDLVTREQENQNWI